MNEIDPNVMVPPSPVGGALLGVGSLFRAAWRLYRSRLKTFLGVMAVPVAAVLIFILVPALSQFFSKSAGAGVVLIILFLLFVLLMIVIYLWAVAALFKAVVESEQGIGIKDAYLSAWREGRVSSLFWVNFVNGIMVGGAFMLFIVPGVIFSVWFSQGPFVVMTDRERGLNALLKSREYVRGRWWGILWRNLCMLVLVYLASFILTLLAKELGGQLAANIFSWILTIFTTPFVVCYDYLLFKNLRDLHTGEITLPKKLPYVLTAIAGWIVMPIVVTTLMIGLITSFMKSVKNSPVAEILTDIPSSSQNTLPSDTLTTATYRNSEYGFGFRYPSDWVIQGEEQDPIGTGGDGYGLGLSLSSSEALVAHLVKYGNTDLFMVSVIVDNSDRTPRDYYKQSNLDFSEEYDLVINGYPAYYVKHSNPSYTDHTYVVSNNGSVVSFSFRELSRYFNPNSGVEEENIYTQYLSDFGSIANSVEFSE